MNPLLDLAGELRADITSNRAVPALSAGITSGLGLLVAQVAFAAFIFSGHLAPYSSQGLGLVLFGNLAACLIIALMSGYRGVIAGLSPALVLAMAVMVSTIEAQGDALFVTASVALILSAVFTGICLVVIGRFRIANLMRFIPYPVAAGFVAGIGGAVCLASLSLMGAQTGWKAIGSLLEPEVVLGWGPGVAYGIALYWAMKRWRNALILPFSVALAGGAYHIALSALGIEGVEARAAGLLLTGTADGGLWPALTFNDLRLVDWNALAAQIPNMLVFLVIAFIAVVMNIAGLEVATKKELDWDREFKAAGFASLVAGAGGGTVATVVVPASLRSKLFGAVTQLTGIFAASVIASALFFGDGLLEWVPTPLVGGILVFAGLGMLDEGLYRSYTRLPGSEFAIVALVFFGIVAIGLPEGVAAGVLATLVLFAVRLSLVDPVESSFTLREQRSNKARPVPERAILVEEGGLAEVYRLRGHLFFGSVNRLTGRLRNSVHESTRPRCLSLDLSAVSGYDYSAVNALSRFLESMITAEVEVVLSAAPEHLKRELGRDLPASVFERLYLEDNDDRAIERCEEIIIESWRMREDQTEQRRAALFEQSADRLERYLERQIRFEELVEELGDLVGHREYAAGETLSGPKTPSEGLQLMLSGRASVFSAEGSRLFQCLPGDPVRRAQPFEEKVLTVVADEDCHTLVISPAARRWLESHRQALALKLYGHLLSDQFQDTESAKVPPK